MSYWSETLKEIFLDPPGGAGWRDMVDVVEGLDVP